MIKERFNMTVWPSEGLPHPTTWNRPEYRYIPGLPVLVPVRQGYDSNPVPCETDEIYVELSNVDLDDPAAILGFVNRWGAMGLRGNDWSLLADDYVRSHELHVPRLRESLAAVAPEAATARGIPVDVVHLDAFVETLDEFRYGAMLIRDMTAAYEWNFGPDISKPKFEPNGPTAGTSFDVQTIPIFLMRQLEPGLREVRPRITPEFFGNSKLPTNPPPIQSQNLYATCCAELFTHIAKGDRYRYCANENCGDRFVRQNGDFTAPQRHAAGLKFCSVKCRNAQMAREQRRRNSAKRQAIASA